MLFFSCACVCRCRGCCSLSVCVCVCDLLISSPGAWPRARRYSSSRSPTVYVCQFLGKREQRANLHLVVCVCVSVWRVLFSVGVCV